MQLCPFPPPLPWSRLHMLEAQCESWGGPVSAVVYLPLKFFNQSNSFLVEQAARQLDELHGRIEKSGQLMGQVGVRDRCRHSRAGAPP